ncbi:MAG: hypothetical protein FWB78_05150 [Treponema sp.]|nr:hypothetical protein [Treponema sp.]
MKKTPIALALVTSVVFAITSCASPPPFRPDPPPERIIAGHVPDPVRDAVMVAPNDALVGIGTANMGTESLSRTAAQTRARTEIVRRLEAVVVDMVADYPSANPQAALLFQESVIVELSGARLHGAFIAYEGFIDGDFWMVVELAWDYAVREILSAVESAANLVPGFNAAIWDRDSLDQALWRNGLDPVSVAGLY